MGKISVTNNVTLDGVMQAPGGPDEDTRNGFTHGGWAADYSDESLLALMGEGMAQTGAMLFGRRTYEQFASYWPHAPQPNPFTDHLNNTTKYVCSNTLSDPLPWQNSVLLRGDAAHTVAEMKLQYDGNISVLGSGVLVRSLLKAGLIDELTLLIHPLVLGQGTKLFAEDDLTRLQLERTATSDKGVIVATYRPMV